MDRFQEKWTDHLETCRLTALMEFSGECINDKLLALTETKLKFEIAPPPLKSSDDFEKFGQAVDRVDKTCSS